MMIYELKFALELKLGKKFRIRWPVIDLKSETINVQVWVSEFRKFRGAPSLKIFVEIQFSSLAVKADPRGHHPIRS